MVVRALLINFLIQLSLSALLYQQGSRSAAEQDFIRFREEYQRDSEKFKQDRERELQKMEQEYQDYINQLFGLRDYYKEKKDTAALNVIEEEIEFEELIGNATGNPINVSEKVEIQEIEEPEFVTTPRQGPTVYEEEKPVDVPAEEIALPGDDKKVIDSIPGERFDTPSLTPLVASKARITSPFGRRFHPILRRPRMHNGVDFGSGMNARIFAAADGKVTLAQYSRTYGNWIIVEHKNGYSTVYAHLSRFNVRVNQQVKRGDVIGFTGNTGRSTGPHLHYEVRKNGVPVNPANYLIEYLP